MKSTPAPFYLVFFTPPLPETNYEKYMFQILPTNRNPTYLSGSLPSKVQAKWLIRGFLGMDYFPRLSEIQTM